MDGASREGWFDELTRLPGPAFWRVIVAAESARCVRFKRPATIVLAETTGFEEVYRDWGSAVALRDVVDVAAVLSSGCRASDFVVRIGETRFGILLTETDEVAAINVVERLRGACEERLASRPTVARIAFGWASNSASRPLVDALERAEERLQREEEAETPGSA
ncbi:MAG TPA: diguanylate cyclase [Clostridia bacterium]|nr:diguanylate cyclase [Clostridia bacterium]